MKLSFELNYLVLCKNNIFDIYHDKKTFILEKYFEFSAFF